MITSHCPACSGPLRWQEETARTMVGELPQGDASGAPPDLLDERASGALRAAIRALEDVAAGVRWRMSRGDGPQRLDEELVRLEHDLAVLNELVRPQARAVPAPVLRQQPAQAAPKAAAPRTRTLPRRDVA